MSSVDNEVELGESLSRPVATLHPAEFVERMPAQLFAVPRRAARARRPTDVTLLVVTAALLLGAAVLADEPDRGVQDRLGQLLQDLPPLLDPVWQVLRDVLVVWAAFLVLAAIVRRHWGLVRDQLLTLCVLPFAVALVGRAATGEWPSLLDELGRTEPPADFPPFVLASLTAIVSVTSPHLARPYRYAGRWIVVLAGVSWVSLGLTGPGQVVGALTLGWALSATVHLLVGSPGGRPSVERIEIGLQEMGVEAEVVGSEMRNGVVWVSARRPDGTALDVKVYGRDAWDGQLLVTLWRFLWYRDQGPTISLTRLQQVEHEAFLTMLAERRGVPVAPVVAAGRDAGGDALLVAERWGRGLGELAEVSDVQLDGCWSAVQALRRAGISHGGLDLSRVRVEGAEVRLSDFAGARVAPTPDLHLLDRAQLLVATAAVAGTDRAVAAAERGLGAERLAELSSFVQPAALPATLRRDAEAAGVDVDEVRAAVAETTGMPPADLQQLRRLSVGRVVLAVLLLVASWMMVSSIADIGLDTIVDAIQEASGPIVLLAFFIGMTPRVANAVAVSGAAPSHVPLGRLTALQFAITFVNMAMPSTAARAAVNIRFFQRSGVPTSSAVSIGVLDSVFGFVGQILLIVTILGFGLGSLELDLGDHLDDVDLQRLLIVLAAILLVAIVVLLVVPRLRAAVTGAARHVWVLIGPVLSSPGRVVRLLGANIAAEMLFALCMYTVLRAFGQDVGYVDVLLVNELVALFAGLMPVPGGVGVTEAALTAGFVALGVDDATAFAAAITYRVVTFYTPPIIGFLAMRWLQRQRYL